MSFDIAVRAPSVRGKDMKPTEPNQQPRASQKTIYQHAYQEAQALDLDL